MRLFVSFARCCHVSYNGFSTRFSRANMHVFTVTAPRQDFVALVTESRLHKTLSSVNEKLFKITSPPRSHNKCPPRSHFDVSQNDRVYVAKHVVLSNHTMQQELEPNHMTIWNPSDIFHSVHCNYAVLVLNRPILWKPQQMLSIWEKAQITVTVDGGTNRWLKYLEDMGIDILNDQYKKYVPDLITGDMDSSSESVIRKLKSLGSVVVETPDQDNTDFTKALMQVKEYARLKNINQLEEIYVFVETTGRFDHIIGNANTLYKSKKLVGNIKVIQVASNSLTWLLRCGLHKINIPEKLVQHQSWCSLIPLGFPVKRISTTGLKWNLNNESLSFGGLVSTSNTYDSCEVTVNTDTPVTWSMGIEHFRETVNNHGAS